MPKQAALTILALAVLGAVLWLILTGDGTGGAGGAPRMGPRDVGSTDGSDDDLVWDPTTGSATRTGAAIGDGTEPGAVDDVGASSGSRRVIGRLVDRYERPVGEATLLLARSTGRFGRGRGPSRPVHGTSDATGRFSLPIDAGSVGSRLALHVRHDEFAPTIVDLTLSSGDEPHDCGDVRVLLGGTVRGRIVDAEGAAGIPNAEVELRPVGGNRLAWAPGRDELFAPVRTDAGGFFALVRTAPGSYRVRARARDHLEVERPGDLNVEDERELDVGDLALGPGTVLSGRVVDARSEPIAGARIRVSCSEPRFAESRTSDDEGRFSFDHVPPRAVSIRASATGFLTWARKGVDVASARELEIRLENGLQLAVHVRDAGGAPVEEFAAASRRLGSLGPSRDALSSSRAEIDRLRADLGSATNAALARQLEARLQALERNRALGNLSSSSRDASERRPTRIPENLGPVEQHAGGVRTFEGLDAGRYAVDVRAEGFAAARSEVVDVSPETSPAVVTVTLRRGFEVAGTIVDADGTPVRDARVELRLFRPTTPSARTPRIARRRDGPRGDTVASAKTAADGSYAFDRVLGARYFVSARHGEFAYTTSDVFDLDADRRDLRIVVPRNGRLAGRVTGIPADRSGQAHVLAFGNIGRQQRVEVAADGTYELPSLQPGGYYVRAFVGDAGRYLGTQVTRIYERGETAGFDVVIEPGQRHTLDLVADVPEVGRVRGTVTRNGSPAANVRVSLRPADATGNAGPRTRFARSFRAVTDQAGQFVLEDVPAGAAWLSVSTTSRSRRELARRDVFVPSGGEIGVDIAAQTGRIVGTIRLPDGELAGTGVHGSLRLYAGAPAGLDEAAMRARYPQTRVSIRNGRFDEADIPTGPGMAIVTIRGYATLPPQPITVSVGAAAAATVELAVGAASGGG